MKPSERAQIILDRTQRAYKVGCPFPADVKADVERQIVAAVRQDWDEVLRGTYKVNGAGMEQRGLIDALIAGMEAATSFSLTQEERVEAVRKALLPFVARPK